MDRRTFNKSIGALAGTAIIGGGSDVIAAPSSSIVTQVNSIIDRMPTKIGDSHIYLALSDEDFDRFDHLESGHPKLKWHMNMYSKKTAPTIFAWNMIPQGYALVYYNPDETINIKGRTTKKLLTFLKKCLDEKTAGVYNSDFIFTGEDGVYFIKLDMFHHVKDWNEKWVNCFGFVT